MPLGITSRFKFISVAYQDPVISSISWALSDGERDHITMGQSYSPMPNYPDTGSDELAALEILRDIYASDDGFLDADDAEVVPRVQGFPHGTTVESLTKYGGYNPFVDGAYEDWFASQDIRGVEAEGASVERDADTNKPTIIYQSDVKTSGFTPETDTYEYPLTGLEILRYTASTIRIFIDVPDGEVSDSDGLYDYAPARALIAWLQSIKSSGSDVGTDYSTNGSFVNRNFTFIQSEGVTSSSITMIFLGVVFEYHDSGDISLVRLSLTRSSGSQIYNTTRLQLYFDETEVTIDTLEGVQDAILGDPNQPVEGSGFRFRDGDYLSKRGTSLVLTTVNEDGNPEHIPISYGIGRALQFADMAQDSSDRALIPTNAMWDTFHFGHNETEDGSILLPEPPEVLRYPGTHIVFNFHNISTTYNLALRDWNGGLQVDLHPGEHCSIQLTFDANGGGELLGQNVPIRHMEYGAGRLGDMDGYPIWNAEGTQKIYILPFDDDRGNHHADVFDLGSGEVGTATDAITGPQGDIVDATLSDIDEMDGTFRLLKSGFLTFRVSYHLELDTNEVLSGAGIRIYRFRANVDPFATENLIEGEMSGVGAENTYNGIISGYFRAGDRFGSFLKFNESNTSVDDDDITIDSFFWVASLQPQIRKEYSAT